MTNQRVAATLAFATFFGAAIATGSLVMPVANADVLPNGYDVSCAPANDTQVVCRIAGCPRVYENYAGDVVHTRVNALPQNEIGKGCNGSITETVNLASAFTYAVQGCRKHRASGDDCGAWSNYTFTPPAKAAPPPPPANVDPKPDPIFVKPPITCPPGSPTPTVPAGGTCDPVPPPKNAVRVTFTRGLPTWTVNVTNSADIAASCTYDASGGLGADLADQSFDIGPKGTASFSVPAPPLLQKYKITTSCRGDFLGKNVEFGHDEQTVSQ